LQRLHLATKPEIVALPRQGQYFIALDFSAYFDQFKLAESVGRRFCFRSNGRFYRLGRLAMGQRQAVEVAQCATMRLLDFDLRSTAKVVIDNVIFVGDKDDVVRDATIFVQRALSVGAQFNEDVSNVEKLVQSSGEWCGVALDCERKTVALTGKVLAKLQRSWASRSLWSWRGFAAHVGLLFWSWGIIDVPIERYFGLLRFISEFGRRATDDDSLWEQPADIPEHVWPLLEQWTSICEANTPREVAAPRAFDWLVCTDASKWGWGYVAVHGGTGEVRTHGAAWSKYMENKYGEKLGKSTFAEPHGIVNSLCHLLPVSSSGPLRVLVGTDNTVAQASYQRGFNSHSFDINECIRRLRAYFPTHVSFDFVHIDGATNVADSLSRGLGTTGDETGRGVATCLQRVVGVRGPSGDLRPPLSAD
jgi:hypothetical protein